MERSTFGRIVQRVVMALAAVLIIAGATSATVASTASPAAASSSTTLTPQYPWPHNGCTGVSDTPLGASFTYACNHHDGCYGGHWASRSTCDAWFYNDMIAACRHLPFEMVGGCSVWAGIYYGGVRAFGQKYYDSNGQLTRINTPMA
jgi:hypothetical protein